MTNYNSLQNAMQPWNGAICQSSPPPFPATGYPVYQTLPLSQFIPVSSGMPQALPYTGGMNPNNASILDIKYREAVSMIAAATKYLKAVERESAEYLGTDSFFKDTRLFTTDDWGNKTRGRPFMNARIVEVKGFIRESQELGAIVLIQLHGSGETREIVIEPSLWDSTKLVDLIQGSGIRIAAKVSRERKRDLLSAHIKGMMNAESFIIPKRVVQWDVKDGGLFYLDGHRKTPVDSGDIQTKLIRDTGDEQEAGAKLELLVRMMTIWKEPEYAALVLLSCAGGFLRSILLRSEWRPEAMLCFCGNGFDVLSVLECFTSFWESVPPRIISAEQSEKRFREAVKETGDELLIVDCGHENTASAYQESQRKANILFAAGWGQRECRCFPIGVSNDLYDVCGLGNGVVPIVLEPSGIQWEVWQEYAGGYAGDVVAGFIQLLRTSVESAGEWILGHITDVMAKQYAAAHRNQARCPGLKAIYQTVRELLIYMVQYWRVDGQWPGLLNLACERGIGLMDLYLDVPEGEFIERQFSCCMETLTDSGTFTFYEVTEECAGREGNVRIFYDREFLYLEMADFRNVVLKEMDISGKNASKVLGLLKEAGYVCPYRNGKDFCVDVTISAFQKRKSMIRFSRAKFQRTGEVDIVMRGGHLYE